MADTYKILGQTLTGELALDNSTVKEVVAYEVPASTKSSISAIEITNSSASDVSYKISFVPSSDVNTATTNIDYSTGYTANRFISLAWNSNGAAYSDDGVTWTQTSLPSNVLANQSAFGNGKFVAPVANNGTVISSTDGITWTSSVFNFSSGTGIPIVFGNNKFVMLRSFGNIAAYSEDGVVWTQTSLPQTKVWQSLAYGNGTFIGISSDSAIKSTDGINWTTISLPSVTDPIWTSIDFLNNIFIIRQSNRTPSTYSSTDGTSWTQLNIPVSDFRKSAWPTAAFGNGVYILFELETSYYYSTNGTTWTKYNMPLAGTWTVSYGNGKFVAIAYGPNDKAAYSTDGLSWTIVNLPTLNKVWSGISFGQVNTLQNLQQEVPQSLNKHIAIYNKTIASGETHEIKGGITLSSGDQIRAYSDSDELIVHVYGVEIS